MATTRRHTKALCASLRRPSAWSLIPASVDASSSRSTTRGPVDPEETAFPQDGQKAAVSSTVTPQWGQRDTPGLLSTADPGGGIPLGGAKSKSSLPVLRNRGASMVAEGRRPAKDSSRSLEGYE